MNTETQTMNNDNANINANTETNDAVSAAASYANILVPALAALAAQEVEYIRSGGAIPRRDDIKADVEAGLNALVGIMFGETMKRSVAEPQLEPQQKEQVLESLAGIMRTLSRYFQNVEFDVSELRIALRGNQTTLDRFLAGYPCAVFAAPTEPIA